MAINWDYFKQLFGNTPQPTSSPATPQQAPLTDRFPVIWHDGYTSQTSPQPPQNVPGLDSSPVSAPTQTLPSPEPKTAPIAPKEDLMGMFPSTGADTLAKENERESESKLKKFSLLPQALAAAGDALSGANVAYGGKGNTGGLKAVQEQEAEQITGKREDLAHQLNDDPNSDVSKQYQAVAYKAMKMLGGNPKPEDFANISASQIQQQMPNIDKLAQMQNMKDIKEAQMEIAKSNKQLATSMTGQKRQEDMEKQAQDRLTTVRGDRSLQNIESQRDAAIIGKNRLDEIKTLNNGNYSLNPIDYADILAQIYKARTGATPTDQMMENIKQDTLKGDFNKWYTKITGQQAPATTNSIGQSLDQLVNSMGKQADQLHDGYMQSRLSLPSDLEPARAERIKKLGRGLSFADAVANNPNTQDQVIPVVGGTYNGAKVTKVTRIK